MEADILNNISIRIWDVSEDEKRLTLLQSGNKLIASIVWYVSNKMQTVSTK